MTDSLPILQLLEQADEAVHRHRVQAERQGLSFNIFDILGLTDNEVHGHSSFISTLLDPKGSHGQRDLFTKHFLRVLADADPSLAAHLPNETGEWRIDVEHQCGPPTGDIRGRIDILLENSKHWIIIENKIYAPDQKDQLERYAKYANESGKKGVVVYLTLDGRAPDAYTLGSLPADQVICIGYGTEVDIWLTRCIESASHLHPIRETLAQYQRLARRLSGGGNLKELTMELSQQLLTPEKLVAAEEIARALPQAKARVQLDFWMDLRKSLATHGADPTELIAGFTPTSEALRKYYSPPRKRSDFGFCFVLGTRSSTRQLVLLVTVYNHLYFGVAAVENGAWEKLTSAEREAVRQVLTTECCQYRTEARVTDRSEWIYPKRRLNFWEFENPCSALADDLARIQAANEIANEIVALRQALVTHLPPTLAHYCGDGK